MHFESQQLAEITADIHAWTDRVSRLDAEARDARRTARLLEEEVTRLRGAFDPIWTLHTHATWVGKAADQSRHRLGQHEHEFIAGLRRIDRVIDDLEARAIAATRAADDSRDSIESARRRAWDLEAELALLDDVVR